MESVPQTDCQGSASILKLTSLTGMGSRYPVSPSRLDRRLSLPVPWILSPVESCSSRRRTAPSPMCHKRPFAIHTDRLPPRELDGPAGPRSPGAGRSGSRDRLTRRARPAVAQRRPHPSSASDSTNRTRSACREIERFIRTLKEQCLWLHRFETLAEARTIIGAFIRRYNEEWIIERLDYRTPAIARQELVAVA